MAVLSAFSITTPRLALSDIVRATDMPAATAHRILEELVRAGFLDKDDRRLYVVGHKVWQLGMLAPTAYRQRTTVVPFLERIYLATRHQTVFTVLDKNRSLVVEQLLGWRDARLSAGLGERLPLHATSPGLVSLAFGPPDLWNLVSTRPMRSFTPFTITSAGQLHTVVEQVRKAGVAITRRAFVEGTASLSAPVFEDDGHLFGSISLVWDADDDVDELELAVLVRNTAQGVTAALRAPSDDVPRPVRRRSGTSLPNKSREAQDGITPVE